MHAPETFLTSALYQKGVDICVGVRIWRKEGGISGEHFGMRPSLRSCIYDLECRQGYLVVLPQKRLYKLYLVVFLQY